MAEGNFKITGTADLSQANRAIAKLKTEVDKIDKSAKKSGRSLSDMGRSLVGVAASAGLTTAAFTALVDTTLKSRLEMASLASQAGLTAPTFGVLATAAQQVGLSSEYLVGGLSQLGQAAYDAANANEEAAKKFRALDVAFTDGNGALRDTEAVFLDVLKALGEIPNEAERTAVAQKLMGESAGGLKTALGELSIEGFEAARIKAHAFTRGLSEEGLEAAAKYEAALTKLDAVVASFGDSISGFAGPTLNMLVDGLTYISVFVAEGFNKAFERMGQRVFLFTQLVSELGPIISEVLEGDLVGAARAFVDAEVRLTQLRESLDIGTGAFVDFTDVLTSAHQKASETVDALNQVHDATKRVEKGAEGASKSIRKMTEATEEFNAEAIVFADSMDQIILEDLGELDDFRDGWSTLTDAAIEYLHTARAMEDLPSVVSEQTLGDLEAFAAGYTQVADIIGRVAGLYVDAAMEADNLTAKQKQAALTAFRVQQAAAIATAVVNTALGVTQALASMPPPLSFVQAGLVAAAGGVSIAEIASQKPPAFAVGGMMPSTGGPAILHPGEGVLSAGAVDAIGGVSALDALNSRSAMGGQTVVVSWKHIRQSFAYEARDGANRPGPLRNIRRDGRRAGQTHASVRADYGAL